MSLDLDSLRKQYEETKKQLSDIQRQLDLASEQTEDDEQKQDALMGDQWIILDSSANANPVDVNEEKQGVNENSQAELESVAFSPVVSSSPSTANAERGLRNAVAGYRFDGSANPDLVGYLRDLMNDYKSTLLHELHLKLGIKFTVCVQVEIMKSTGVANTDGPRQHPKLFSRMHEMTNPSQIDEALEQAFGRMDEKLTKWTNEGSGWNLQAVMGSYLNIFTYRPLTGSSFIQLPKDLKAKHAIVNVKNRDQLCFMWSVLAALYPAARDACRVTKYTAYQHELNFDGITFPVSLRDVPRFEKLNDISINVYTFEIATGDEETEETLTSTQRGRRRGRSEIIPLYVSSYRRPDGLINPPLRHVDLLSFGGGSTESSLSHYAWIKDFNRLLCKKQCQRTWHCRRCLHRFWVREKYLDHVERDCKDFDAIKVKLPPPHKAKLEFDQPQKQLPAPFYIVFDIESLLEPIRSVGETTLAQSKRIVMFLAGMHSQRCAPLTTSCLDQSKSFA